MAMNWLAHRDVSFGDLAQFIKAIVSSIQYDCPKAIEHFRRSASSAVHLVGVFPDLFKQCLYCPWTSSHRDFSAVNADTDTVMKMSKISAVTIN